jgi:hypothetical protein
MKRSIFYLYALAMIASYGCFKDPELGKLSSNFVVATNSAATAVFSSYQTYYVSDSVASISGSGTDTSIKNANSQQLVDAIKQNMNARGYTFVNKSQHPDLGINLGVVKLTSATTVYPGWWTGYPGWYDPWYWGGYYPYYYPWSVTYVITTGSVVVDIVDVKNSISKSAYDVLWTSVMGGAVGDDLNANVTRGVTAINQSFAQTPGLKRN